ncbi:hypothetical protein EJ110_NYTH45300 [Nymphaea thermarum]|nr:hypothetical protein EJ110_NYTH45300 [Nymphaea thermarum]
MAMVEPYPGRDEEMKAFDDTKAGVKGLVDAGITSIPRFFFDPRGGGSTGVDCLTTSFNDQSPDGPQLPSIDMLGLDGDRREEIVREVLRAAEEWGFFEVVNHSIPRDTMEEMMAGIRRFNEQGGEEKRELYGRDIRKKVRFTCTFDLFRTKRANWRDTLYCFQMRFMREQEEQNALMVTPEPENEKAAKQKRKKKKNKSSPTDQDEDYLSSDSAISKEEKPKLLPLKKKKTTKKSKKGKEIMIESCSPSPITTESSEEKPKRKRKSTKKGENTKKYIPNSSSNSESSEEKVKEIKGKKEKTKPFSMIQVMMKVRLSTDSVKWRKE